MQAPVGRWDPLRLAFGGNLADFKRHCVVDIKYGRIALHSTIDFIVPWCPRFSGEFAPLLGLMLSNVPNGLAALSTAPLLGWPRILFFVGIIATQGFFSGIASPSVSEGLPPG